jgi:hypothetical protein
MVVSLYEKANAITIFDAPHSYFIGRVISIVGTASASHATIGIDTPRGFKLY